MDLAEAEAAALTRRPSPPRSGVGVANVGQPWDPVEAFEARCREQFKALEAAAKRSGGILKSQDIPPLLPGATPGREVTVYMDAASRRVWKATFPGKSGCGPFGFFTPAAYLRRLQLSNSIFNDDVGFEGIWKRKEGLSIVTSQSYIQPHPERFIPTEDEIEALLSELGFAVDDETRFWTRGEIQLGDIHDRNFIRAPDGKVYAIDVQPRKWVGDQSAES